MQVNNLRDHKKWMSGFLKEDFLGLTRKGKTRYYLTVRRLSGFQLQVIQRKFVVMEMEGQNWDYGDILITLEKGIEKKI